MESKLQMSIGRADSSFAASSNKMTKMKNLALAAHTVKTGQTSNGSQTVSL